MNCDSKSYSALRHMSQTILQQMVEVNKHIAINNDNKELAQEDKDRLVGFANYHLLVLSILLNDSKEVALKEFPDASGIIQWSENLYNLSLEQKLFTTCKCKECSPEVEAEIVETKA